MAETLLSPSHVLLFGREVEDLKVVVPPPLGLITVGLASDSDISVGGQFPEIIDGYPTKKVENILLKNQKTTTANGVYRRGKNNILEKEEFSVSPYYVKILGGRPANAGKTFSVNAATGVVNLHNDGDSSHSPFVLARSSLPGQVQLQLEPTRIPVFARIYAFSFEGYYYDLARPILFLVHGKGIPASEAKASLFGRPRQARAPGDPSLTGIGQADFQFSDDIMVWSYDKADYTIRMDVETGMFEDVLLAAMLGGGPGGMDSAGMNARGMNARGMNARGMNARGMNARGMNARGGGNSD